MLGRVTPSVDLPSSAGAAADLHHHGDAEVAPGLVDLAVNVRRQPMPAWLDEPIARGADRARGVPRETRAARAAVAARHGRDPAEVLLTAGAAQAFVLIAQALRDARRPVVVHPQFTEPEAALRNAGHVVERVLLREADGFRLDPRPGARRRGPGLRRQPHQSDVGAAPGRRRGRPGPARAGCWWWTRRSPTPPTGPA